MNCFRMFLQAIFCPKDLQHLLHEKSIAQTCIILACVYKLPLYPKKLELFLNVKANCFWFQKIHNIYHTEILWFQHEPSSYVSANSLYIQKILSIFHIESHNFFVNCFDMDPQMTFLSKRFRTYVEWKIFRTFLKVSYMYVTFFCKTFVTFSRWKAFATL